MGKAEKTATGADAIELLNQLQAAGEIVDEVPELPEYEPLDTSLPGGWRFRPLKQKHLMAFYDSGITEKTFSFRFRQNYEAAVAAIEAGFFEMPTGVDVAMLDDMEWWEVEQIRLSTSHLIANVMNTPKN